MLTLHFLQTNKIFLMQPLAFLKCEHLILLSNDLCLLFKAICLSIERFLSTVPLQSLLFLPCL